MSEGRQRRIRRAWIGFGIGLVVVMALLPGSAQGAKYAVAQCGWYVGQDADWGDSTGGAKFRPGSWCVPAPGADPFDGVHMKSFTREGAGTVSGTRFARWRWQAPPRTGITAVRGTWWHALRDGIEHRLGAGDGAGGFDVFASADATDTGPSAFTAGFGTPRPALESRLLCARTEDRYCSLDAVSFSAVRALTITLEDSAPPTATLSGEPLVPGWHRGELTLGYEAADAGSGVRFSETLVDGARVALTEHPCAKEMIAGEWRATRMRPCELARSGSHRIGTAALADGPHLLRHCTEDFAGARACGAERVLLVDNGAPAAPRALSVSGGEGWRAANGFDVSWTNPDQGPASPIAGASYRVTGPGYDSGNLFAPGRDLNRLLDLDVPAPGEYALTVWLRDEAGNENPAASSSATLRFDDRAPEVGFLGRDGRRPELLRAWVRDAHSGPATGTISYRGPSSHRWIELPTALRRENTVSGAGRAGELVAHFPSDRVAPGVYRLRAEVTDGAGNVAVSDRYGNGTAAIVRTPLKRRTRLTARLEAGGRRGTVLTAPFRSRARVAGRLISAAGAGLAGRELRVVIRSARGSFAGPAQRSVRTGRHGYFRLALGRGPSRGIRVSFAGTATLGASRSAPLRLRVRAAAAFRAAPRALRTGDSLQMSGAVRLRGAAVPRRGKLVAIQYYETGARRWRPVIVTRTDRAGRFRSRYRFRYVTGTARIRLRVAVMPEHDWPYAPGASRSVTVSVRG